MIVIKYEAEGAKRGSKCMEEKCQCAISPSLFTAPFEDFKDVANHFSRV